MSHDATPWIDGIVGVLLVLGNLLALPLWGWLLVGLVRGGRFFVLGFFRVRRRTPSRTGTDRAGESR